MHMAILFKCFFQSFGDFTQFVNKEVSPIAYFIYTLHRQYLVLAVSLFEL